MSADRPHVSVIVPFYNATKTIQRAIDSIAGQTFRDWELLIIDDGSSSPLPSTLGTPDPVQFRILRHEENKGAAAARNTGIRESVGRWIAFLDADDVWHPTKLEYQLSAMEHSAVEALASVTGFDLYRNEKTQPESFSSSVTNAGIDSFASGCNLSPGSTLMVKRYIFEKVGYYDEGLRRLEDWDWLIKLSGRYEIISIPETLTDVHVSQTTGSSNLMAVLSATRILRHRYLPLMSGYGPGPRRHFLSTLLMEDAAAYHRAEKNGRALILSLRALILRPRLLRKISRRVAGMF